MPLKLSELPIFDQPYNYHFILVICSNNVFIVHRFRDNASFTLYVTACDLEKSFSFHKIVEITGHVRSLVHV